MQQDLRGRAVIVTGAASGLGEATARVFAREGCKVACLDISEEAVRRVSDGLNAGGGDAIAIGCDVSDAEDVFAAVEEVVNHFRKLDIVVNAAGVDHTYSVDEMTVEQWDQVIGVNLRGPFLMAKASLPALRDQGGGHIVNVGSTAGLRAWANTSAYHASKWGLIGFGRGLGVEGREDNIRVTTLIPGGMRTRFFDRFESQGIPMPDPDGLQDPVTVAETILFAVRMPGHSVIQELLVTPLDEPSWP